MLNNPLKYTDPSGHFFSSLLHLIEKIGSFLVSYAPTIVSIATAAILGSGATFLQAVLHGAAAGFMGGLVGSGSLHGALDGAFWGGITAGVVRGVGHGFGYGNSPSPFGSGKWLVHGIAQGTISELRGGNFRSGFVGAVAGSVAGGASGRVMGSLGVASNVGSLTAVAGIFGGLAAKASGGSFEDGAVSAAFTHLFNYEAGRSKSFVHLLTVKDGKYPHSALVVETPKGSVLVDPGGAYAIYDPVLGKRLDIGGDIYIDGWSFEDYVTFHQNDDGSHVNILTRYLTNNDGEKLYNYIIRMDQDAGSWSGVPLWCASNVSAILSSAGTAEFDGFKGSAWPNSLEENFAKW